MGAIGTFIHQARSVVPRGVPLATEEWEQRHRWIIRLVWLHVPFVLVFAAVRGVGPVHAMVESAPIALMGVAASRVALRQRVRAMAAGLGLMLASAVLVHLSGGVTEVHFHFFVMVGVIALYQDWSPFLVSIGFVAVHHALAGALAPEDVFDKPEAWRNPLLWAGIHAVFVLAASAASVAAWGIVEAGHRRSKAQLAASERRFRSLIEESSDVVTVVTPDGLVAYESPASERILGTRRDGRIGTRAMDVVLDDDRALVAETMACVASPGAAAELEFRVRHVDGSVRWVEASVTNLVHEEAIGGFVVNYRDVTERRNLEDQLAHQAFHDPLTGLANRALLLDRIEHALTGARLDGRLQLALLYLDLDDFKTVNDALGHDVGDEVLREAARRILGALRPGDTAARLGGDEFAVLLTDLPNHDVAYEVGARVLEALATPVDTTHEPVVINASIGIALSNEGEDASALLRNADLAMYRAKGEGKGRFEIYEAGMHAVAVERIALKAELRRAIEAGEFEPYYQPIVDLPSGRIVGAEALVRWNHPDRGLVSPAAFVPIAEESGLIVTIGSQVLHRACRDAAGWARDLGAAAPSTVSVNLSPRQILDPGVVADVEEALVASGLAPSSLVLEITESILVDDTEAAARTLGRLKALGVRIALDDFGTGYSSLTYLDRFPVDVLKIDKSFVDALGDGGTDHPLVAAIVHLGRTLGLQVTAEGVEGPTQLAQLRSMGCGLGQGYYFARPMPAEELRRGLEERVVAVARAIR